MGGLIQRLDDDIRRMHADWDVAIHVKEVDAEHLYAALSAYMLAGIFFGLFYWVLEQIGPGTFAPTGDLSAHDRSLFQLVTLTTLGYGDIVLARTWPGGFCRW